MSFLTTLIMFALAATIVSLVWGVGSMAHGGQFDNRHSNHLMAARVFFQGLVVALMLVAFVISAG